MGEAASEAGGVTGAGSGAGAGSATGGATGAGAAGGVEAVVTGAEVFLGAGFFTGFLAGFFTTLAAGFFAFLGGAFFATFLTLFLGAAFLAFLAGFLVFFLAMSEVPVKRKVRSSKAAPALAVSRFHAAGKYVDKPIQGQAEIAGTSELLMAARWRGWFGANAWERAIA